MTASALQELRNVVTAHGFEIPLEIPPKAAYEQVREELGLPDLVVEFYEAELLSTEFRVPWVSGELLVGGLTQLIGLQEGYRWGAERIRLPGWQDNWIVVASMDGDPFIVDTSRDTTAVLWARHGIGSWEFREVASSMREFIEALVRLERVLLDEYDEDVFDDDSVLLPDFVRELTDQVGAVLTAEQLAIFWEAVR